MTTVNMKMKYTSAGENTKITTKIDFWKKVRLFLKYLHCWLILIWVVLNCFKGSLILVKTSIPKNNIFYHVCVSEGVRNVSFSDKFAKVLN